MSEVPRWLKKTHLVKKAQQEAFLDKEAENKKRALLEEAEFRTRIAPLTSDLLRAAESWHNLKIESVMEDIRKVLYAYRLSVPEVIFAAEDGNYRTNVSIGQILNNKDAADNAVEVVRRLTIENFGRRLNPESAKFQEIRMSCTKTGTFSRQDGDYSISSYQYEAPIFTLSMGPENINVFGENPKTPATIALQGLNRYKLEEFLDNVISKLV